MNRASAWAAIMLGIAIAGSNSHSAYAEGPDRLPQMTALIEDAAVIATEIATCRSTSFRGPSEKWQQEVETALRGAGLEDQQISGLLHRFTSIKPLIGDDRPIAEAILFCDSRPRGDRRRTDRFFRLADLITVAAGTPAGRDDALVREAIEEIVPRLRLNQICLRLESGPLPASKGIDPGSAIGKELARFDISAAMREHLDIVFETDASFDGISTVGDLRAICNERADAADKVLKETGKLPGILDSLKAIQPTR